MLVPACDGFSTHRWYVVPTYVRMVLPFPGFVPTFVGMVLEFVGIGCTGAKSFRGSSAWF